MASIQVIKVEKQGNTLELICKPGMITKFRKGECSMNDVLIDDKIYSDSSKGDLAPQSAMDLFNKKGESLLEYILKEGKYQLTTQEKREMVEQCRKDVARHIHNNYIDSVTKIPHPLQRIELALQEVKFNPDPDKSVEANVKGILNKLTNVIRLTESTINATVTVPNKYIGKASGLIYSSCNVLKEDYGKEAAVFAIELAPGKYEYFYDQLAKLSSNEASMHIEGALPDEGAEGSKNKGGKNAKGGKGKKK